MPRDFVRRTFDNWIKKNRQRFLHPPYISESRKGHFELLFAGVTSQITCSINTSDGATLAVLDKNEDVCDLLGDFELLERRGAAGKDYCGLCIEPICFDSRRQLWEQHVFENLLAWTNENFRRDRWLGLEKARGVTQARFLESPDAKPTFGRIVEIVPIVTNRMVPYSSTKSTE